VASGNVAYFSRSENGSIYSYTLPKGKWAQPYTSQYSSFGIAILKEKLTTIGGTTVQDNQKEHASTNDLLAPLALVFIGFQAISTV